MDNEPGTEDPLVEESPRETDPVMIIESEVSSKHRRSVGSRQLAYRTLQDVGCCTWVICFLGTVVPATLTALMTSGATDIGKMDWILLHAVCRWFNERLGAAGWKLGMYCTAGALLAGWVFDLRYWRCWSIRVMYLAMCFIIFLCSLILFAEQAPSMLLIIGVGMSMLVIVGLRATCLKDSCDADEFNFIISCMFMLISVGFSCFWVLWSFTSFLGGVHDFNDLVDLDRTGMGELAKSGSKLTLFILWAAPAILAGTYFILALFIFKRGQFHVPEEGSVHVFTGFDGVDNVEADNVYVGQELKFIFYVFVLLGCGAWVAASVAAKDVELSHAVLRINGSIFFFIVIYLWFAIGPERIVSSAKEHPSVKFVMDLMLSDWMKAIFLVFLWPVLPIYVTMEFVRQRVRSCLTCGGCVDRDPAGGWITSEGNARWGELSRWNWRAVLVKSILVGTLYFSIQIGASTGTTIFLSWLAEVVKPWPSAPLLIVLFFVGLTMFLIPVVPGVPVYLVAGIIVVQKYEDEGFITGVTVASLLCWAIKLCSNIVLMKCIGEPFADNLNVRMIVQTHTPTMRAAEKILMQPGLTLAKVAVLVGCPDWPTPVLCAMLKIPVLSMLIGISPVIVIIVPVVLAAAFMLQASKAATVAEQEKFDNLSTNLTLVSILGQMGSMVVSGMYLYAIKQEFANEFKKARPEDKDIFEALEKSAHEEKIFHEKSRWEVVPWGLKGLLVTGSWLSLGIMYITNVFSDKAFMSFELTDKLDKFPDGNPIWVFKPLGFLCLGFVVVCIIILNIHKCWCRSLSPPVN